MENESENQLVPTATPEGPISPDDRTLPFIAYGFMAASPFLGMTGIIGVVLAYVARGEVSEDLKSHYTFIIRTFWFSFMFGVLAFLAFLTLILIPFAILMFLANTIWVLVRMITAMVKLSKGEAISDPGTVGLP